MILHIASRADWLAAQKCGEYRAASLEIEGFIHCSLERQTMPVANTFYQGQNGLVLMVIDEARLRSEIRWEAASGSPVDGISQSELFPHVYGSINLDAVVRVVDFKPDITGKFCMPVLL
jgi:uncharacterized protein (DUF952 family)